MSQLFISLTPGTQQSELAQPLVVRKSSHRTYSSIIIESFVSTPQGEISILSEIQVPRDLLPTWEVLFSNVRNFLDLLTLQASGKKFSFSNLKVIKKQLKSNTSPIYGVYNAINPENHITTQEYDPSKF